MIYRLIVKDEAIQDMTEGFAWYEDKRVGLGVEFLNEVDEYFNKIAQNPEQYQSHQSQRIAIMFRFPYKIVFEIEKEIIVIYSVYHDKRDPEKLSDRK